MLADPAEAFEQVWKLVVDLGWNPAPAVIQPFIKKVNAFAPTYDSNSELTSP
ncbi:hypothetical protein D3C71_1545850 [compost metagenome]